MKKSIADKWVKALRSGEYKQGKFALRSSDNTFCCLGVLCDISKLSKWKKKAIGSSLSYSYDDFILDLLPDKVRDWSGLNKNNGAIPNSLLEGKNSLAELNDAGVPFDQIADYIEKNWQDL